MGTLAVGGVCALGVVWEGARQVVEERRGRVVRGTGLSDGAVMGAGVGLREDLTVGAQVVAAETREPRAGAVDQAELGELLGLERSFVNLAKSLSRSVVAVTVMRPERGGAAEQNREAGGDAAGSNEQGTSRVVGSGFVLDGRGSIATSLHVVEGATSVEVTTDDGRVMAARVVGVDERFDLAVLRVERGEAAGLKPVVFSEATPSRRGPWVMTMGNPYGLAGVGEMAFSVGVIAAVDRELPKLARRENRLYTSLLQVTLPLNPGNSGGAIFDLRGRLVGVAAAVVMPQRNMNGVGFAIPASGAMRRRLMEIAASGECVYGSLGVELVGREGVTGEESVVVAAVEGQTPLRPGDELLRVGGTKVRGQLHARQLISDQVPGDRLAVEVLRDGKVLRWEAEVR